MISQKREIYINSTIAYCTHCSQNELARIVANKTGVYLEKLCPNYGVNSVKIASDYKWYMEKVSQPQIVSENNKVKEAKEGCPHDCGICEWHSGSIQRIFISITNNLHSERAGGENSGVSETEHFKTLADIKRIVDHIKEMSDSAEIINLVGYDAQLHPNLFDIINACKQAGFKQIFLETNGLSKCDDLDYFKKIKQMDVHLVLSIDTLDPGRSILIHGKDLTHKKLKTLAISEALHIPVNILLQYNKGVNEVDVSEIPGTYIKKDFVRNIIIQDKTFNGRNNSMPQSEIHTSIDEVEKLISINQDFSTEDFAVLNPYHPLCFSVAYYIVDSKKIVPLSKIFDKSELNQLSVKCCQLDLKKEFSLKFRDGLNRLWSLGEDKKAVKLLKQFVGKLYQSNQELSNKEKWEIAAQMIKGIFIHQYMDESNFDIDRVSRCGDFYVDESEELIPVCSYNLINQK